MSYVEWIRSRVGKQKIFLVYATVILWDDNGRILCQQRTDFDWWGLPGGVLELDESIEQCARRELLEETGLRVDNLELVGVFTHPQWEVAYPNGDAVQQYTVCFSGQRAGGTEKIDAQEIRHHAFFRPEEIQQLTMPAWYEAMLAAAVDSPLPTFTKPFRLPATSIVDQIWSVRPHIGRDWLIGVGAMSIVQDEEKRVLMIQRRDVGKWIFPAGYSDLGENVANTAVRETQEETGIASQPERIIAIYSSALFHHTFSNGHQVKNVGVLFKSQLLGNPAITIDQNELLDAGWFTVEDARARVSDDYAEFGRRALDCLESGYFVT